MKNNNVEFKTVNIEKIKHLKNKKFFELKDLEAIFPDIDFFIVKGKKNIGKTYTMIERMKEVVAQGKQFLYIRITESEVKTTGKEWTSDPNIPFFVKANRIYDKETKKDVGQMGYLKNLQRQRSLQYNNYSHIFFDEFVGFDVKVYGGQVDDDVKLVRQFIQLIMDVQRTKRNIKVFCFGNNNIQIDIFTKFFRLNYKDIIQIDKKAKVLFLNLQDYYVGGNDTLASRLSKYDQKINDYLIRNNSLEDLDKIVNYDKTNNGIIHLILLYNNNYYSFIETIEKNKLNKFYIITDTNKPSNNNIPLVALTKADNLQNKNSIFWPKPQYEVWIQNLANLIKFEKVKFTDTIIESAFIRLTSFSSLI